MSAAAEIRSYQPGDAKHMVRIYNRLMKGRPGFTPDSVERLERVYSAPGFDPQAKLIAVVDGLVIGYMTVTPAPGAPELVRINYPYVLSTASRPETQEATQEALYSAAVELAGPKAEQLETAHFHEAWSQQVAFMTQRGFEPTSVRYRVLCGELAARRSSPAPAGFRIRPADQADFAEMAELSSAALGDCNDPPRVAESDFKRQAASPALTRQGMCVAETNNKLAAFIVASCPPPAAKQPREGFVQGPFIRPDSWQSPLALALWNHAVSVLVQRQAASLKAYVPDAGTPETQRLLDFVADRGLSGDDSWLRLRKRLG